MTSVIYVDLSSDSEEEGPPNAKRARREQTKMLTTKSVPTKLLHIPKASVVEHDAEVKTKPTTPALTETVLGTYRSMHIPSGITVTKHNNINGNFNSNNNNSNKNNNNNNNSINKNSLKCKQLKLASAGQNVSVWSKAPTTTLATITSVPSPQMLASKAAQVAATQQHQKTPTVQKQTMLAQQKATIQQQQQRNPTLAQFEHKTSTFISQQQQQKPMEISMSMIQKTTAMLQLQELQQIKQKASTSTLQQQQRTQTLQMQKPPPPILQQQQVSQQKPLTSTLKKPKLMLENQKHQLSTHRSLQSLLITQKLPVKNKPQALQHLPALQKISPMHQKSVQLLPPAQKVPPPAHSATALCIQKEKQQQLAVATLASPPPAHHSISTLTPVVAPPQLAKLTSMPMLSKPLIISSAARHLPYKIKPIGSTTSSLASTIQPMQSVTAGATPPLRLLATPPHCAAALNEPLLLNLPPTTSITPQLTPTTTPPPPPTAPAVAAKQSFPGANISPANKPQSKRVQPITVLKKSDEEWRKHLAQQQEMQKPKQHPTIVLVESPPTTPPTEKMEQEQTKKKSATVTPAGSTDAIELNDDISTPVASARVPLVPEYTTLLQLCRELDNSNDMERLIEIKLLKYYYSVHESFVRSRGFRKQLVQTMERMRSEPDMIYVHLKCVVEELKVRRKAKMVDLLEGEAEPEALQKIQESAAATLETKKKPVETAPATTTGNKRTDERIRKLNRTLYTITKRIRALEEAEVDWNDDDDSSYLQVERFKKRACQIYEKICDLTGESKSAHRQMKQPILFKDTPYPQFNRTLSAFVNRMHEFPDYHDVLQLLEHCNKEKDLGLVTFEMKRIAHDAFVKVGRLLQARRKTDLYETVTHFTANSKDPATSDASLLAKLNDNNKKQTKISDIIEKFAREQDLTAGEQREARIKEKQLQEAAASAAANCTTVVDDEMPCTSAQAAQAAQEQAQTEVTNSLKIHQDSEIESDSYDDEDANDETDEDVDTFVDSFTENGDLSDLESETETKPAAKTPTSAAPVIVNSVTRVKTAAARSTNIKYKHDVYNANTVAKTLHNGEAWDAPAAHLLKIMSVSSLNATISSNNNKNSGSPAQHQHQQRKQRQDVLKDTEIVISDEES